MTEAGLGLVLKKLHSDIPKHPNVHATSTKDENNGEKRLQLHVRLKPQQRLCTTANPHPCDDNDDNGRQRKNDNDHHGHYDCANGIDDARTTTYNDKTTTSTTAAATTATTTTAPTTTLRQRTNSHVNNDRHTTIRRRY